MRPGHNPYATALDGLALVDPVTAFFDFCREREHIRHCRESGSPAPWSNDPIFQHGRFLNVFREDDRGSQAILRFSKPVADDLSTLVHSLFFARWCNRQTTLDQLSLDLLEEPESLRRALEKLPIQPWCNVTAYPVEAVRWEGTLYSRFDTATTLFGRIRGALTETIKGAGGDVIRATRAVNAMLGMENDFPIFMAVMDLAWFRPDIIDPASPVPTGIGAVAFLDRLQKHLGLETHQQTCERMIALQTTHWPEAKRPLLPIDVEYLSCECRKYYSYVNGTKKLEGKNVFRAGKSAQLMFDIPEASGLTSETETQIYVLAGGPCSGKTTLLRALAEAGHRVEEETAERVLEAGVAAGRSAEELRAHPIQWQEELLRQDYALFDGLPVDEGVFTDTSFLETLVFSARAGIELGPCLNAWVWLKRYKTVFFLDPLEGYEQSEVRIESQPMAMQISAQVRACYQQYGYEIVAVPSASVVERVAFIHAFINEGDTSG